MTLAQGWCMHVCDLAPTIYPLRNSQAPVRHAACARRHVANKLLSLHEVLSLGRFCPAHGGFRNASHVQVGPALCSCTTGPAFPSWHLPDASPRDRASSRIQRYVNAAQHYVYLPKSCGHIFPLGTRRDTRSAGSIIKG